SRTQKLKGCGKWPLRLRPWRAGAQQAAPLPWLLRGVMLESTRGKPRVEQSGGKPPHSKMGSVCGILWKYF
ncbi:MAG: hypothetical protein WAL32_16835, partial [Terriglobales bacterium]